MEKKYGGNWLLDCDLRDTEYRGWEEGYHQEAEEIAEIIKASSGETVGQVMLHQYSLENFDKALLNDFELVYIPQLNGLGFLFQRTFEYPIDLGGIWNQFIFLKIKRSGKDEKNAMV